MPQDVGAWLHIGEDGVVTAYTGKVEVGQNSRTSLTAAVAEELRVPVASVRFIMGDTALTPFDGGTAGSGTTPNMWPQIRRAAATAREMLLDLAAQKWNADRASISIANGKVTSGSHTAGFGELTQGQKLRQDDRGECAADAGGGMEGGGDLGAQGRRPRDRDGRAQIPVRYQAPRHVVREDPVPAAIRRETGIARSIGGGSHGGGEGGARSPGFAAGGVRRRCGGGGGARRRDGSESRGRTARGMDAGGGRSHRATTSTPISSRTRRAGRPPATG